MKPSAALAIAVIHAAVTLAGTAAGRAEVTYSREIAPIIQEKCVECHRPGEAAPFPLQTFGEVRRRARTIIAAASKRHMPPWHAVGGDVPIVGERRLTDDQIALLRTWVENGTPEGNPAHLPPPRDFPVGWRLGEPDLVLEMEEAYSLPADGPDIYRNFVIPTRLAKERWLKAIEFRPGSPKVVHHSLFYLDTSKAARRADDADPAPGFAEMPLGEGIGRLLGGWVPGSSPLPLPEGLAFHIPKGADLVLSTHFHLSGKPESERSRIGLYFGDTPPARPFTSIQLPPLFGAFAGIDIAPDEQQYTITDSFELPVGIESYGATAHAHYLGESLRLTAELPDGTRSVLLNIPDWDFSWQEEYRFAKPVFLPAGTRLVSTVIWNNSSNNPSAPAAQPSRVHWGRESFDEMGSLTLLVTTANERDLKTLRSFYSDHLRWQAGSHIVSAEKLDFAGELRASALRKFDENGDGELDAAERARARAFLGSRERPVTLND